MSSTRRNGLTLVELMVALVITLLLVVTLAEVFAYFSTTISANRAAIEMAGQIRGVTRRLQPDIEGITVPVRPWPQTESGLGYFEYFEGPERDYDAARADLSLGDVDDILMFTSRSASEPYLGRIAPVLNGGSSTFFSNVAEIVWWTSLDDRNGNGQWDPAIGERFRLHRRTFLIRPDLNNDEGFLPGTSVPGFADLVSFQNANDLSVHTIIDNTTNPPTQRLVANSLADLTVRKNRFAHLPVPHTSTPPNIRGGFPHIINNIYTSPSLYIGLLNPVHAQSGIHIGEDVVLANVLAFDVRAYDPTVVVRQAPSGDDALLPGDRGYTTTGGTAIGSGGYVDLNHATPSSTSSTFSGAPHPRSQLWISTSNGFLALPTYDTWSYSYEHDGINQDGPVSTPDPLAPNRLADPNATSVDEGTDGFDTAYLVGTPGTMRTYNGVDDVLERETSPPYPVPLRGIQVRIRMIDPDSRQVEQMTVAADFTPE